MTDLVAAFPATSVSYANLGDWLDSFGQIAAVGVQGTGTWGVGLARHLTTNGLVVIEVDRPDRKTRRFHGKSDKSDPIDAEAAARAVLSGRAKAVPKTNDGLVGTFDIAPIQLSRLERQLEFNNTLAHRANRWLTNHTT